MKRIAILSAALATGVITAVAVSHFLIPKGPAVTTAAAHWKDLYRTPGGLVAGANLVVVADHLWAEPGRIAGDGDDVTPFTNNTFAVGRILRGVHEGATLVLEQTGGIMANGTIFNINDGGPYEPGESYLLFLKRTGEGSYYLISHQARYRVRDGFLEGVDPTDPVVAQMHGQSLDRGLKIVEKRARIME